MKRAIVLLILVGLVGLTVGCRQKTTTPGISKVRPAQQVPKK
jgi:hypothetical protein